MEPDVSICIATYRRPAGLERLLESLGRLKLPPGCVVETIVVEPGADRLRNPIPEIPHEVVAAGHMGGEDPAEIDFAELLDGDRSVIELSPDPSAPVLDEATAVEDETIIMDNGSIRSLNTDRFRVPTFVRKQID